MWVSTCVSPPLPPLTSVDAPMPRLLPRPAPTGALRHALEVRVRDGAHSSEEELLEPRGRCSEPRQEAGRLQHPGPPCKHAFRPRQQTDKQTKRPHKKANKQTHGVSCDLALALSTYKASAQQRRCAGWDGWEEREEGEEREERGREEREEEGRKGGREDKEKSRCFDASSPRSRACRLEHCASTLFKSSVQSVSEAK